MATERAESSPQPNDSSQHIRRAGELSAAALLGAIAFKVIRDKSPRLVESIKHHWNTHVRQSDTSGQLISFEEGRTRILNNTPLFTNTHREITPSPELPENYNPYDEIKFNLSGEDIAYRHDVLHLSELSALKRQQGLTLIVIVPTRNEGTEYVKNEKGEIVKIIPSSIKTTLSNLAPLRQNGFVDKIIVTDSNSEDETEAEAREFDIDFISAGDVLKKYGYSHDDEGEEIRGKGAGVWSALVKINENLRKTGGDPKKVKIALVDADFGVKPGQVQAIFSPLVEDENKLVSLSVFYRKTHQGDPEAPASQGGRVTRFTIRPLWKKIRPRLAKLNDPLSGNYAVRLDLLLQIKGFPKGYGIETAIDMTADDRADDTSEYPIAQVVNYVKEQDGQTSEQLELMADMIVDEVYFRNGPIPDGKLPSVTIDHTVHHFSKSPDGTIEIFGYKTTQKSVRLPTIQDLPFIDESSTSPTFVNN